MFDKNLFIELCEKYDVELSDSVKKPMIRDGNGIYMVAGDDVSRYLSRRNSGRWGFYF